MYYILPPKMEDASFPLETVCPCVTVSSFHLYNICVFSAVMWLVISALMLNVWQFMVQPLRRNKLASGKSSLHGPIQVAGCCCVIHHQPIREQEARRVCEWWGAGFLGVAQLKQLSNSTLVRNYIQHNTKATIKCKKKNGGGDGSRSSGSIN